MLRCNAMRASQEQSAIRVKQATTAIRKTSAFPKAALKMAAMRARAAATALLKAPKTTPMTTGHGKKPKREKGHPLKHVFTRAIPTAQCMTCHMHQPNIFLNSYLGYTMWDYESDAPMMWSGPENQTPRPHGMSDEAYEEFYKTQRFPTAEQVRAIMDRNPEGAAARGMWADVDFLRNVYELNPELEHTQFADYHGHGWNFRGIFKRDRDGNLLDAEGEILRPGNPETDTPEEQAYHDERWRQRWRKDGEGKFVEVEKNPAKNGSNNPGTAVHMMSIHAEVGMQCVDCHYEQDTHGNGLIYGEVANAIEIGCKDCHGTADALPTLRTSGPAAPPEGHNLALLRNPDGQRRFEWTENEQGRARPDPALYPRPRA